MVFRCEHLCKINPSMYVYLSCVIVAFVSRLSESDQWTEVLVTSVTGPFAYKKLEDCSPTTGYAT